MTEQLWAADEIAFVVKWYNTLKKKDGMHNFEEYVDEETGVHCNAYTLEIFTSCPMVQSALEALRGMGWVKES